MPPAGRASESEGAPSAAVPAARPEPPSAAPPPPLPPGHGAAGETAAAACARAPPSNSAGDAAARSLAQPTRGADAARAPAPVPALEPRPAPASTLASPPCATPIAPELAGSASVAAAADQEEVPGASPAKAPAVARSRSRSRGRSRSRSRRGRIFSPLILLLGAVRIEIQIPFVAAIVVTDEARVQTRTLFRVLHRLARFLVTARRFEIQGASFIVDKALRRHSGWCDPIRGVKVTAIAASRKLTIQTEARGLRLLPELLCASPHEVAHLATAVAHKRLHDIRCRREIEALGGRLPAFQAVEEVRVSLRVLVVDHL